MLRSWDDVATEYYNDSNREMPLSYRMATVHRFSGGLLVCASSSVFLLKYSHERLLVHGSFNARGILRSMFSTRNLAVDIVEQPDNPKTVDADVQILCSAVSNCGSMLAVGTSEKVLIILETHTLTKRRSFRIPKAPTSIAFDKDDFYVVLGDRAGHVRRYSIEAAEKCGYIDMNGEECTFEGQPLTGAITMILDIALSRDGNFLLAADRDEKIRVSRYPQAYVVQSYCLGHSAYVSSMALNGNRLFSAGGDGVVIEWNMECGKVLSRSERLDGGPLRRIVVVEKDETIVVVAVAGCILHVLDEYLQSVTNIRVFHAIMDVAVVDGSLLGVSSAGVTRFDLSDGTTNTIEIPNELCKALLMSNDPISSYFKNVVHQNTLNYHKRKAEKFGSSKENLRRKRKVEDLSKQIALSSTGELLSKRMDAC